MSLRDSRQRLEPAGDGHGRRPQIHLLAGPERRGFVLAKNDKGHPVVKTKDGQELRCRIKKDPETGHVSAVFEMIHPETGEPAMFRLPLKLKAKGQNAQADTRQPPPKSQTRDSGLNISPANNVAKASDEYRHMPARLGRERSTVPALTQKQSDTSVKRLGVLHGVKSFMDGFMDGVFREPSTMMGKDEEVDADVDVDDFVEDDWGSLESAERKEIEFELSPLVTSLTASLGLTAPAYTMQDQSAAFDWSAADMKEDDPAKHEPAPTTILAEKDDKQGDTEQSSSGGVVPPSMDVARYDRQRTNAKFKKHVPSCFATPSITQESLTRSISGLGDDQKVLDANALVGTPNPHAVTLVALDGLKLNSKQASGLCRHINRLKSLRILILRDCGIKDIDEIKLPKLVFVDVKINGIKSYKSIVSFCRNCPFVQHLDARANPATNKDITPLVIAEIMNLETFNGQFITIDQRNAAVVKHGRQQVQDFHVPLYAFDKAICKSPEVVGMPAWNPAALQHLKLQGQNLECVHVGDFSGLITIDVSHNRLRSLAGSGLEKLDHLKALNASNNLLDDPDDLKMLGLVPSLRMLMLAGNRLPINYRLTVAFYCRNLAGLNYHPGMVEIDNEPITIDELMEAYAQAGANSTDVGGARWAATLARRYGHRQLTKEPGYTSRMRTVSFPARSLTYVSVASFKNVTVVDLSNNNINVIKGLDGLPWLRSCDLSDNPSLPIWPHQARPSVTQQLESCKMLEILSLRSVQTDSDSKFRPKIIGCMFRHCPLLRRLDDQQITPEHRAEALKYSGMTIEEKAEYLVYCAITMSCTAETGRNYHPEQVRTGKQWRATDIISLRHLTRLGFTHRTVPFHKFKNLTQLRLSDNSIKDLPSMQLDTLNHLEVLDVRRNKIAQSIQVLADHVCGFPALEVLCIEGNPSTKGPRERKALIGSMSVFREVECRLHTIDYPVSTHERVDAWKAVGGSTADAEKLRFDIVLFQSMGTTDPTSTPTVNVCGGGVTEVHLSHFTMLKVLVARENNIRSLASIMQLKTLEVLDLRSNRIKGVDDCAKLVNALPLLTAFASRDNPMVSTGDRYMKYRKALLSKVPRLREPDTPLQYFDELEITTDEIIEQWKGKDPTTIKAKNTFKMLAEMHRCVRGRDAHEVLEMDFHGKNVKSVDLTPFQDVKKLSLAHNPMELADMKGISDMSTIEELDISACAIKNPQPVASLVDRLPQLKSLYIDGNKCFPDDSLDTRVRFLAMTKSNADLDWALKRLNGFLITVQERSLALEQNRVKKETVAEFKTDLALQIINVQPTTTSINLEYFDLTTISRISQYTSVRTLHVARNNLTTLVGQGIEQLRSLEELDLRQNMFGNLSVDVVLPLTKCDNLKVLLLKHCTKVKPETADAAKYISHPVCHHLRGLVSCDEIKNPNELKGEALQAAEYLLEHYEVGFNSHKVMDVTHRSKNFSQLVAFAESIAQLEVEQLQAAEGNPWGKDRRYRFILIDFCPSLQELDGRVLLEDERELAHKKVMEMNLAAKTPWLTKKKKMAAAAAVGAAAVGAVVVDQTETEAEQKMKDNYGQFLSKVEIVINFLQVLALSFSLTITWPDWWFDLNLSWAWLVDIDLDFSYFEKLRDYQYTIKWMVMLALPPVLVVFFKTKLNQSAWHFNYNKAWKFTKRLVILEWLACVLFGVWIGYFVDLFVTGDNEPTSWELADRGELPNALATGIATTVIVLATVRFVLRWAVIKFYRKKSKKDTPFWPAFVRLKGRFCLFFLLIMYQPVIKNVLSPFARLDYELLDGDRGDGWYGGLRLAKTDDGFPPCMLPADKLLPYDMGYRRNSDTSQYRAGDTYCCQSGFLSERCLTKVTDLTWVHVISLLCGLVYMVGIPVFAVRLIRDGVAAVDHNYGIVEDVEAMKKAKSDHKEKLAVAKKMKGFWKRRKAVKQVNKEYKTITRGFRKKWASSANELQRAQTYLYASFQRKHRFFKIVVMLEKLVLMIMALFFASQRMGFVRTIVGLGVVGSNWLLVILTRPFSDIVENGMDLSCRLTNTFNVFVGLIGFAEITFINEDTKTTIQTSVLAIVNVVNIVVLAGGFLSSPVRAAMGSGPSVQGEGTGSQAPENTPPESDQTEMDQQQARSKLEIPSSGAGGIATDAEANNDMNELRREISQVQPGLNQTPRGPDNAQLVRMDTMQAALQEEVDTLLEDSVGFREELLNQVENAVGVANTAGATVGVDGAGVMVADQAQGQTDGAQSKAAHAAAKKGAGGAKVKKNSLAAQEDADEIGLLGSTPGDTTKSAKRRAFAAAATSSKALGKNNFTQL